MHRFANDDSERALYTEFLPGKRALAIGFCIYHSIVSTVLFQAPRFIPYSFGAFMESYVFYLIFVDGL